MSAEAITLDWSVTREKVDEAIRRILAAADPLQIIAFGSRARGDHRPDNDLDLAISPGGGIFASVRVARLFSAHLK